MLYRISPTKPQHTRVVVNTFPESHLGQIFIPLHGIQTNFAKQDGELYFQVQIFFRALKAETKEIVYEFRTCSDYTWDDDLDNPDHPDFMLTAVATMTTAIADFNWYIKGNKSKKRNYTGFNYTQ